MESHGREENCKAAQSFHQDQSVRTSKGREVRTMVCGGPCRLPSQEVPNTEPMEPSFGRTIDRGFLKSLRTPRFECFYFDTLPPTCSPSIRGDFHQSLETKPPMTSRPHMMRVMALENIGIDIHRSLGNVWSMTVETMFGASPAVETLSPMTASQLRVHVYLYVCRVTR